jgi:4-hydroxy-2-oxoheptanedioate aldolase
VLRQNRVKRVADDGGMALVALIGTFQGPTMAELIGLAGYDGALIDMEHGGFDLDQVQVHVLACEIAGITPIVRVPSLDVPLITRLLDIGDQGIQLSGVSSADEARALVHAVRFPPLGSRGLIGNSRALRFGGVSSPDVMAMADREVLTKITIENREGLEAVEEIAAIDGIDFVGTGPHDISAALGAIGQPDSPVLKAAMDRVVAAARATGKRKLSLSTGHPAYPLSPAQLFELGVSFVPCQPFPERRLLAGMKEQVKEFKAATGQAPAA